MKLRQVVLFTACLAITAAIASAQSAVGHWEGAVEIQEKELSMTVDLAKNSKGDWIGSISIPLGGLIDLPLNAISFQESTLRFQIVGIPDPPSFEGKLSADGYALEGTATSDKGTAPFRLVRKGVANVKIPPPSTPLSKEFEGSWEGALVIPDGRKFRAILKLTRGDGGIAVGKMISVDEGGRESPITTITQKEKHLEFEIRTSRGRFTGVLNEDGQIVGEYALPAMKLPLVFKPQAKASVPNRP